MPMTNAERQKRYRENHKDVTRAERKKRYRQKHKVEYDQTIYVFDIETSSYFEDSLHHIHPIADYGYFKRNRLPITMHACCYQWQFSQNLDVQMGNKLSQFIKVLEDLEEEKPNLKKVIWVHNLSFEFHWLCSLIDFEDIFARKSHKVMSCKVKGKNIYFRCSMLLANASLSTVGKNYNLKHKKKDDALDYTKIRTPKDFYTMTAKEKEYCKYDCLCVYDYIREELKTYKNIEDIPKTSTGKIRKELKEDLIHYPDYKSYIDNTYNKDIYIHDFLVNKVYSGGYTHANCIFADEIIKDVHCFDLTSSYPAVMVLKKFPIGKFVKDTRHRFTTAESLLTYQGLAKIAKVTFYNLNAKLLNHFISFNKCKFSDECLVKNNFLVDNGRIISAEEVTLYVNDVDMNWIRDGYEWDESIVEECYYTRYGRLPKELVEFVLNFYEKKCLYKHFKKAVEKKEEEKILYYCEKFNIERKDVNEQFVSTILLQSKAFLNGIYGMCVTNNIRADVEYLDGEWIERELSLDEAAEKLIKGKWSANLLEQWGVWVSSLAKWQLLKLVIPNDINVVYCDTDSAKMVNVDEHIIDRFNEEIEQEILEASIDLGINVEKFAPVSPDGKRTPIGVFDIEDTYAEFKTLGCKKYCHVDYEGNCSITVAGVPQKAGTDFLNNIGGINAFNIGLNFDGLQIKKNGHCYITNQPSHYVNGELIEDKTAVAIFPCDYTLSITSDYDKIIKGYKKIFKLEDKLSTLKGVTRRYEIL